MEQRFTGRRALVTCADRYMGPACAERLSAEGAEVITSRNLLRDQAAVDALVAKAGEIDILIANFAEPPRTAPVGKIEDADWLALFDALVHPLMRIVRAVAPGMQARGSGKIVAITSAAPLRGIPNTAGYCAARGAQNAFIRAVGMELAKHGVQVNAVAQNYISNDTYYPKDFVDSEAFQRHLQTLVPSKRVAPGSDTAALAAYLASDDCTHMVGQIVPLAGGWV